MVWPYGEFNGELIDLAAALGMPVTMTTAGGPASSDRLDRIPRYLLTGNPALADVVWQLRNPDRRDPPRAVQVDLDYVYDPDPRQQARNLDLLLDRVRSMAVNYVYLQAFADPDGDDVAASVYFRNRHLPVRADLFNRVAWQLRTRAGVRVLAWMPVLAFDVPGLAADRRVMREVGGRRTVSDRLRLSPFDPEARKVVLELYEDLARHAHFQGLLFHDDARLDDFEDAGPAALERFAAHGLPPSIERIRADPSLRERATRIRTTTLTRLTDDIAARVRRHRGEIETARSMFAQPLLDPAAEEWFGQSLTDFLDRYDHTVVMAYPYMEQATRPMAWLEEVAAALPPQPDVRDRVLLQLQTRDWRSGEPIAESTLEAQIRRLQSLGVRAFAWYPDDFHRDQPPLDLIRRTLSLRANPWQP
jgi:biofilm PGA synthesis lipoprotein PgaB